MFTFYNTARQCFLTLIGGALLEVLGARWRYRECTPARIFRKKVPKFYEGQGFQKTDNAYSKTILRY